jgi:hypothetical protein
LACESSAGELLVEYPDADGIAGDREKPGEAALSWEFSVGG